MVEFSGSSPRANKASQRRAHPFYLACKRALDIVAALLALILFSPLFALLALQVYLDSRRPILHRRKVLACQKYRDGEAPQTFAALKFRTMIAEADDVLRTDAALWEEYQKEFKLRNDPRITPLGRRLRRASLDELPQLINILKGEMSLVGPRIISPPELVKYGDAAATLLSVKPGLTGLWQVSGRTDVSYRDRVRLDLWYIENRSFWLDVKILARTFGSVLSRRGAF